MERVLVVAAHPDDELLGCGATIAKFIRKGWKIKVLFLGEGSTCRFDDPASEQALNAVRQRNNAAKEALTIIGLADFTFCNLPCGRFDQIPIIQINKLIESEIQQFLPTKIFTHSISDSNNDHKIAYRATVMATRPCGKHLVRDLFSYEVLSSSEWGFSEPFAPNYFIEVERNDVEKKWEALVAYGDEMREYPFPRSREGVLNLAKQRGMQSGTDLAEAFKLIRRIEA